MEGGSYLNCTLLSFFKHLMTMMVEEWYFNFLKNACSDETQRQNILYIV